MGEGQKEKRQGVHGDVDRDRIDRHRGQADTGLARNVHKQHVRKSKRMSEILANWDMCLASRK